MAGLSFRYVTYVAGTPQLVWDALTSADASGRYWGHRNVSDWRVGSEWRHVRLDEDVADALGRVLEVDEPRLLRMTFEDAGSYPSERPSVVTFALTGGEGIVRIELTQDDVPDEEALAAISLGWPAVLANLKTYLETGAPLPQPPWTLHA